MCDYATYSTVEIVPNVSELLLKNTQEYTARDYALLQYGIWRYTPLYKHSMSGSVMEWWVGFDIRTCELLMTHGFVNGEAGVRTDRTLVELNKSGRNMHTQSMQEARNKYLNKYRGDLYRPAGEESAKLGNAMLANKWTPEMRLRYPVACQPKLNGIRCLCRYEGGKLLYRTRSNLSYSHLNSQFDAEITRLMANIPMDVELDGELYIHGVPLQTIASIIKNERIIHPDLCKITYCIFTFNSVTPQPFENRCRMLMDAQTLKSESEEPYLRLLVLNTQLCNDESDIHKYHEIYESQGYEGIMLYKMGMGSRNLKEYGESLYKSGRSNNLLKLKKFQDEEGFIVDVSEGSGLQKGLALLVVRDPRGNVLNMSMKYDFEYRAHVFLNKQQYIGKSVTYKYQELTIKGVPTFARVVCIRDYE
jgi:DNA ligase 1